MPYTLKSAVEVWNQDMGIGDRVCVLQQQNFPHGAVAKDFEKFSQSEQEKLICIDWEMSTGKRFPRLVTEKERRNANQ